MPIGQMRQTVFTDQTLTQMQSALNDQFAQISKIPFMNGRLIESVHLTSGQANVVNTGLGAEAQGYFVTSNSANSVIWNDTISGDTALSLRCSATTIVDIWVF